MKTLCTLLLVLSATTATPATAQESRNLFAGTSVAVSLDPATSASFAAGQLYLKRPGFPHGTAPKTWATTAPIGSSRW